MQLSTTFNSLIPDSVTIDAYAVFILLLGALFFYMLIKASRSGRINWTDFITAKESNKASLTKFLQLVGGVVGTWIIIQLTLKGKLTSDYLIIYLTYVGAIEGWSKFVSAKYGAPGVLNGNGYSNGNGYPRYPSYSQYPQTDYSTYSTPPQMRAPQTQMGPQPLRSPQQVTDEADMPPK